jgi:uncharacterized membrane protein YkvA (DUF1232 family)
MILWRAFLSPHTPLWLKGLMLLIPAYLISPFDLIPDFIPVFGWLDDLIIVPLLVSWIVSLMPRTAESYSYARRDAGDGNGPVIDGDYRRL